MESSPTKIPNPNNRINHLLGQAIWNSNKVARLNMQTEKSAVKCGKQWWEQESLCMSFANPTSASAADAITFLMIFAMTATDPFSKLPSLFPRYSSGIHLPCFEPLVGPPSMQRRCPLLVSCHWPCKPSLHLGGCQHS